MPQTRDIGQKCQNKAKMGYFRSPMGASAYGQKILQEGQIYVFSLFKSV